MLKLDLSLLELLKNAHLFKMIEMLSNKYRLLRRIVKYIAQHLFVISTVPFCAKFSDTFLIKQVLYGS